MKPAAKIIVRAPSGIPAKLVWFALAGGIALILWNRLGALKETHPPAPAVAVTVEPIQQVTQPTPSAVPAKSTAMSTAMLRGEGCIASEWLKRIVDTSNDQIQCLPDNLAATLNSCRICHYEGDESLPIGEALDLLRYAGVSITRVEASNGIEIRWPDSRVRIADDMSAGTNPDSLAWGALRKWQHMTIKLEASWRVALDRKKAPATAAQLRILGWALYGERCSIEIGADGHVTMVRSNIPVSAELDAALEILAANQGSAELAGDVAVGLAPLAASESPSTARALSILIGDLSVGDIEVRRLSAWALGQTSAVPAVEALVNKLESADCPPLLVSAILAALTHSEKLGRGLDANHLGAENWARRQDAYTHLRNWLAMPGSVAKGPSADNEFAAAFCAAAESFQVDASLPHLNVLRAQRDRFQTALFDSSIAVAGPNWLHVPFEVDDALKLLRTGKSRSVLAALWRWNRQGSDAPTAWPMDDTQVMLADSIQVILKTSTSITQRRLALEALFRRSDPRLGSEPKALSEDAGLALNVFLNDSSPAMQRSAANIVGRSASIVHIQLLIQAGLAARPPAGTDQLLRGLVQRFWISNNANDEEVAVALGNLVDQLLSADDLNVAESAAWAKMQNPGVEVGEKLAAAKAMARTSIRAAALKGIAVSRIRTEVRLKLVDIFLYDNAPEVRVAVFSAHLPQLVKQGVDRTKLYARGLQDPEVSVRLAVLNSKLSIAADSREALSERVKALSEVDTSAEVRAAASAWFSTPPRLK